MKFHLYKYTPQKVKRKHRAGTPFLPVKEAAEVAEAAAEEAVVEVVRFLHQEFYRRTRSSGLTDQKVDTLPGTLRIYPDE